jgi:hypothetical protein
LSDGGLDAPNLLGIDAKDAKAALKQGGLSASLSHNHRKACLVDVQIAREPIGFGGTVFDELREFVPVTPAAPDIRKHANDDFRAVRNMFVIFEGHGALQ